MMPFLFLSHKPRTVKFKFNEYTKLVAAVNWTVQQLTEMPFESSTKVGFRDKLGIATLAAFAKRLRTKPVYRGQDVVSLTFQHDEALAFIDLMQIEAVQKALEEVQLFTPVQHAINNLHKHYV